MNKSFHLYINIDSTIWIKQFIEFVLSDKCMVVVVLFISIMIGLFYGSKIIGSLFSIPLLIVLGLMFLPFYIIISLIQKKLNKNIKQLQKVYKNIGDFLLFYFEAITLKNGIRTKGLFYNPLKYIVIELNNEVSNVYENTHRIISIITSTIIVFAGYKILDKHLLDKISGLYGCFIFITWVIQLFYKKRVEMLNRLNEIK